MYIVVIESFIVWVLQVYGSKYTFVWHPGIVIFLCIAWIKKIQSNFFEKVEILEFWHFDFKFHTIWNCHAVRKLIFYRKEIKSVNSVVECTGCPPKKGDWIVGFVQKNCTWFFNKCRKISVSQKIIFLFWDTMYMEFEIWVQFRIQHS